MYCGVLARFNRWTQHLDDGGVFDGTTTGMGSGVDGAGGDALTGTAAGTQDVERAFWGKIAEGLSSEDAAMACGVSGPGARWFRHAGGMPPIDLSPVSGI
jgi:hypothetical protein